MATGSSNGPLHPGQQLTVSDCRLVRRGMSTTAIKEGGNLDKSNNDAPNVQHNCESRYLRKPVRVSDDACCDILTVSSITNQSRELRLPTVVKQEAGPGEKK